MLKGLYAITATPFERELTKASRLGFFLGEVGPALGTQPTILAGLHATFWHSFALALGTEFEQSHSFTKKPFGIIVPLRCLISS